MSLDPARVETCDRGQGPSILFIASSRIGDAVLASGLIKHLHDEHRDARFTVAASALSAPLFADIPRLERLIVMQKGKGGHWLNLWGAVRGRYWDLIVDRRGSAIAFALRARRRAIHRRLTEEPVHKVVEAARLLKMRDDPPAPFLFTSSETEAKADALLTGAQGPILAVAPGANWPGKRWPPECFASLGMQLTRPGQPFENSTVLILGGPDDSRVADGLRCHDHPNRWIDLTGKTDLLTAYACLKRARLFVGNDSGLMHLAAAAGAPTLGLFGPSDERLYCPWGKYTRVSRGPRSFAQLKAVDPHLNQDTCHMLDLTVETVLKDALVLFEASRPRFAEGRSIPHEIDGPRSAIKLRAEKGGGQRRRPG